MEKIKKEKIEIENKKKDHRVGTHLSEERKAKISKTMSGRTYEQIYGVEKAKQMKEEKRKQLTNNNPMMYMEVWNKGKIGLQSHSEETKIKLREYRKNQINSPENNPEIGKKVSKFLKGKSYDEVYGKVKAKKMRKCRSDWALNCLKTKYKKFGFPTDGTMKLRRAKQVFPMKDTAIELKIQGYLKQMGLNFLVHNYRKEIALGYQSDILIPVQLGIKQKTIIECDGDWWHGNTSMYKFSQMPKYIRVQIPLDFERTFQLQQAGFRVIRLWEHDIKTMTLDQFKVCLDNYYSKDIVDTLFMKNEVKLK